MISRVAESCFWLARYLERLETLARLLDVHHALHIDAGLPVQERWRVLVDFSGQEEDYAARIGRAALDDGEAVQRYLTWDEKHPASLFSLLRGVRENAREVREVMSLEAWETINDVWLWLRGRQAERLYERERGAFYERLMRSTLLFHGVSHATMIHDEPFTFMKVGRAAERAGQTARILLTHWEDDGGGAGSAVDAARCLAVLRCCCAYDPFFRSGMHPLGVRSVTGFLVFDRTLPRSVLYSLGEARGLLAALRRQDPIGLPRRSHTALERLWGELLQMDMHDVEKRGIESTLAWTMRATDRFCDAIHEDYLDPPTAWLRHCVRALESAGRSADPSERAA